MSEPFPLCPVHSNGSETAELVWDGRCHAIAGPAYAIGLSLKKMTSLEDVEISWYAAARPELPPEHPHNFLVMPIWVVDDTDPDFVDLGNGSFIIPRGTTIEVSPKGEICVFRAEPERHTRVAARPIHELN